MKFTNTEIPGLIICEPSLIKDKRGFFTESFRHDLFEKFLGNTITFCQENLSNSNFGVLRGLHFQIPPHSQSKLVTVLRGKILDVVVDLRKESRFFAKNLKIELDDVGCKQLFIPKGFAHGFIVLSDSARVSYKVDNYYDKKSERGLNYNDPKLNIDWKIDKKSIIQNEKDKNYPPFDNNYFF